MLLSTAMLGGLAARASEAAGWTEIREHEVSLTFGWRWSDDQDSDPRRRYKSRPAGADPPPVSNVGDQAETDGGKARDHVQQVFGLFAKLYHRMHGLPGMDVATLSTVEEVLFDASRLVESAGAPDRLVGCEVASAHVLGLGPSPPLPPFFPPPLI